MEDDAMDALGRLHTNSDYNGGITDYQTVKAALTRPAQPAGNTGVDLDELKKYALNEFMKGRSSKELRDIVFEIISETFNVLKMKGYLSAPDEKQLT